MQECSYQTQELIKSALVKRDDITAALHRYRWILPQRGKSGYSELATQLTNINQNRTKEPSVCICTLSWSLKTVIWNRTAEKLLFVELKAQEENRTKTIDEKEVLMEQVTGSDSDHVGKWQKVTNCPCERPPRTKNDKWRIATRARYVATVTAWSIVSRYTECTDFEGPLDTTRKICSIQ